jgi:phospholipid/cholesterol/gamma-HCH transport system substrate-binding protein
MTENRKGFGGRLLVVVLATALAVFTLVGLAYEGGALHFGKAYTLQAVMPTTSSLISGASVTMAGADVGRVTGVKQDGDGALVTMSITDKSVTPIPTNSRVALRETTAVGENYVEIDPGTAKTNLASGAVLPMSQADAYVDVDQLMSVLQGSTKARTQQLIEALGSAVGGQGQQLNQTIAGVNNTFYPVAHIVQVLHTDQAQTVTLVHDLGEVAAAAGQRGSSILTLADDALSTFKAVGAQDSSLKATLDQLPSTLSQVKTTAGTLGGTSDTAAPVLTKLADTLHDLRPAIQSLGPAASEGRTVVSKLQAAAPGLSTTLTDGRKLSTPAEQALPQLQDALCQANPMLKYIQPYTGDIISFVSWFGSAVNAYDNVGHLVRLVPIVGDDSLSGLPPAVSTAAYDLLHAGLLENTTALTWDPYPAPGQIGKEHAGDGTPEVIGPSDLKSVTGYTYPHITASCTA